MSEGSTEDCIDVSSNNSVFVATTCNEAGSSVLGGLYRGEKNR